MDRLTQEACTDAERGSFAIRLEGISKSFANAGESLEVLKNINLTIAEQAIVGLLGASGSGKSTLLNIISGIIKPDRGLGLYLRRGAAMSPTTGVPLVTCSRMTGCCRGAQRFAMSNLLWRQDHCPRRNVLGAHAKRYGSSNWKDSKKRSLTSFPAA